MNEQRVKTLREALEPMRGAVDILGNALVGAKDDGAVKEEINTFTLTEAFTLADVALEFAEIASGTLFRVLPRPFLDEVANEIHEKAIVAATRAYNESRLEGRAGLDADQRKTGLRDALRLMRRAQVSLDAVEDAEKKAFDLIPVDIRLSNPAICDRVWGLGHASLALENAIGTVKVLTGLPRDPSVEKLEALARAIEDERRRVDAEIPEMQRLQGEHDRLWEDPDWNDEDPKWDRPREEVCRLRKAMDQFRMTDDRYAEVRRLCAEQNRLVEEMKRTMENLEGVQRGGFRVISGAA